MSFIEFLDMVSAFSPKVHSIHYPHHKGLLSRWQLNKPLVKSVAFVYWLSLFRIPCNKSHITLSRYLVRLNACCTSVLMLLVLCIQECTWLT